MKATKRTAHTSKLDHIVLHDVFVTQVCLLLVCRGIFSTQHFGTAQVLATACSCSGAPTHALQGFLSKDSIREVCSSEMHALCTHAGLGYRGLSFLCGHRDLCRCHVFNHF